MVRDYVIQFDNNFAAQTNLIVCESSTWPLMLGRNVQEAILAYIIGTCLYYYPPNK